MPHTDTVAVDLCASCTAACPVRTDTHAYVDLIARGRYEEAFEVIRRSNPFPAVCSLICHHPCEQECRRTIVDDPIALRNLKRFAVEQAENYRKGTREAYEITQTQTVGVVGAGPAGLTAALDAVRQGYAVTVYDALPRAGGFLAAGIPKYRLPDDALEDDIADITAAGVAIKTGVRVGVDVSLDELRARHDAVILALGLAESRMLPLENADHADVLPCVPFLRETALDNAPCVREHVIVIGGGNVAVDVARTAIRLGAETVKMVCLENEEEMPAWDWEREEALEEGIEIVHRRGPTGVVVEGGSVTGLAVREVARVFDDEGRFAPTYNDDCTEVVPGGMVIVAIGQQADLALVDGTDVAVDERGRLVSDLHTMATSAPGVFVAGEVVTGPGSAIEAVASGHRAAQAVISYLKTGRVALATAEDVESINELPTRVAERVQRAERRAMPAMSAEERRTSFVQFEMGYSEQDALAEARRCLSCTLGAEVDESKCAACLTCQRVCPFGVPVVTDVAMMHSDLCQSCGLCAVECPGLAISIRRFAVGDIRDRIVRLITNADSAVTRVEIVCANDAASRLALQDRIEDGVAIVPVSCAARAEEVDMMKPFELGVQTVAVRRCDICRYDGAMDRLEKRVVRTQSILTAAGIGGDKLELI
jgi:NADPH-dependent glutamate synthase beta subunit-like oxidoreductase/Fe-S-cluster-containing hydrogenase component 2